MLRFTRRQYESVLRRGGVPEGGLGYDDNAALVGILDDFREQQPEATRPHAYGNANIDAVAIEWGTYELVAPPGGLFVRAIKQLGCAAQWGWGVQPTNATTIATPTAVQPTVVDIQTLPAQAVCRCGTTAALLVLTRWGPMATGVEDVDFPLPGIFIPPGHMFWMQNASINDANYFLARWAEPGV